MRDSKSDAQIEKERRHMDSVKAEKSVHMQYCFYIYNTHTPKQQVVFNTVKSPCFSSFCEVRFYYSLTGEKKAV